MSDYWRGFWFAMSVNAAILGIIVAAAILFAGCAVSTVPAACPAPPAGTYMATHTVEEAGCGLLGDYAAPVLLPDGWWSGVDTDGACVRERALDAEACSVAVVTACGPAEMRLTLSLDAAPERMEGVEEFVGDGCVDRGTVVMERVE